jgi:hypothetical protein
MIRRRGPIRVLVTRRMVLTIPYPVRDRFRVLHIALVCFRPRPRRMRAPICPP